MNKGIRIGFKGVVPLFPNAGVVVVKGLTDDQVADAARLASRLRAVVAHHLPKGIEFVCEPR